MNKKDKSMMELAYSKVCENFFPHRQMQFDHNRRVYQQAQNEFIDAIENIIREARSKNLQQNYLYRELSSILDHMQRLLNREMSPDFNKDDVLIHRIRSVNQILSTEQETIEQFNPRNIEMLKQSIRRLQYSS